MKDAGSALSSGYKNLLSSLAYNSLPVGVYSGKAPDDATPPYVIIGPWQPQSDNTKDSFGQKGEINLDVFTRFAGNVFSKKPARDIANLITELLKPTVTAEVLTLPGFHSWNTVVVGTTEIQAPTGTDTIYRLIITVSHSLLQV